VVAEPGVTYEITSCNEGDGFDTQLALYKANSCLGWESFELLAANDDMAGGCSVSNGYSSLFYASCLEAGEVYYIQVDGWEGSIGSALITVRTVEVENELQAIFNNISCPISKGEIPQSSILPYMTGSGANFECEWVGPGFISNDQNIFEIGPGLYSLTATDACGVTHQASFEVTQPDLWNITATELGPTCEATSDGAIGLTVFGATPPYSFEWIGPSGYTSNEQDLSDVYAGNYQITVTDNNECEASAYVVLEPENSFSFSLGNDTTLCLNDSYLLVAPPGLFYVWQDQSINQFYNIDAETWGIGQHAVILTATTPDGCVYADDLIFTVQDCANQIIDWSEAGWNLYPNPSAEMLNLEWDGNHQQVTLMLTDMQGRVVDQTSSSGSQRLAWNPAVAPGTYQVIVESEGKRFISRWTKCN
jgi:hypothetical protein